MSNARNIANLPNGDDAPIYACRAWVNFRGTTQSGTLNTSGPVTGLYTVTVTGATTFTIEYSSTTYTVNTSGNHEVGDGEGVDLTISGTSVTIETQIRESANVSSIYQNATGNYTVNFATAMPDTNYSPVFIAGKGGAGITSDLSAAADVLTTSFDVRTRVAGSSTLIDADIVACAIFR